MGSYPVPGDWFDNVAAPSDDEDFFYSNGYDVDDELEVFDGADPRPSQRFERVELDPLSDAVHQLRRLASRLAAEQHRLAHVPQQVANSLVDVRAPAPRPPSFPVPGQDAEFAASPTGNCARCQRALPLPTMKRGRPRTLCELCSPRRGS